MTKYYRKAGTIAYRYIIQAEIEKIELKVPVTGPYPQRISVIFKRGDVRRETKNAPLVEGGTAYFNEKLSSPATIYYDTRKRTFLQKEATFAVNVYSKRSTKLMGVTKFDLAPFLNQNIREQSIILKMDKCPDKNAKFFLKLTLNQIMELGTSKRASQHSFKDMISTRNGSMKGSMKESLLDNIQESFKENYEKNKEESKVYQEEPKEEDQIDDIYSYYTGTNSPRITEKVKELEEGADEIIVNPMEKLTSNGAELDLLEENYSENKTESKPARPFSSFGPIDSSSPQKLETSMLDEYEDIDEEDQDDSHEAKDIVVMEKELNHLSSSLRKGDQGFNELKENYDRLKEDYNILNQKYEEVTRSISDQIHDNRNVPDVELYESKISELEKRCKELESKNDLLTRKVEDLDHTNLEYLTRIRGYIEQENRLTHVEPYDITDYEKAIENMVLRLKEEPNNNDKVIKHCERFMKEAVEKLADTKNVMIRKDEIQRLEKEKTQKQIQALEQNIQHLLRENEQYNQKQKPKTLGASFDNTGLFASFKTREESVIEDNVDVSKIIPSDLGERPQESYQAFEKSGNENSKAEVNALKQEIAQLNSKLSATVNLQKKYEEEVQKQSSADQELKSMKKELEKAKKGWSYAEEERYELASKLEEYESGSKTDKKIDNLETELFKLKAKLCEVMNVAFEFGRSDMLDRIETIMSTNELSDLRSSIKQSCWYQ